jgi:hypothetical protein
MSCKSTPWSLFVVAAYLTYLVYATILYVVHWILPVSITGSKAAVNTGLSVVVLPRLKGPPQLPLLLPKPPLRRK